MYQNFVIPYLYEAQHVSDDTPPIISAILGPDDGRCHPKHFELHINME